MTGVEQEQFVFVCQGLDVLADLGIDAGLGGLRAEQEDFVHGAGDFQCVGKALGVRFGIADLLDP